MSLFNQAMSKEAEALADSRMEAKIARAQAGQPISLHVGIRNIETDKFKKEQKQHEIRDKQHICVRLGSKLFTRRHLLKRMSLTFEHLKSDQILKLTIEQLNERQHYYEDLLNKTDKIILLEKWTGAADYICSQERRLCRQERQIRITQNLPFKVMKQFEKLKMDHFTIEDYRSTGENLKKFTFEQLNQLTIETLNENIKCLEQVFIEQRERIKKFYEIKKELDEYNKNQKHIDKIMFQLSLNKENKIKGFNERESKDETYERLFIELQPIWNDF